MRSNRVWPKISVITPSFNQGQFIKRTIESVLSQNYPNLEYYIIDGGSTDMTLKVLEDYGDKIKWISEKDNGQTEAINKGLKMATGDILAYLNSDDTYEPGAFKKVAEFFQNHPGEVFVYGKGRHIDKQDRFIEDYPSAPTDMGGLKKTCAICQPTAFWRKKLWAELGEFKAQLHYAMDYEYWLRVVSHGYHLAFIDEYLGNTRLYAETKTLGQREKVMEEIVRVNKEYYGKADEDWIFNWRAAKMANYRRENPEENRRFLVHLIWGSIIDFWRVNHSLPPLKAWYFYGVWLKEILVSFKTKC